MKTLGEKFIFLFFMLFIYKIFTFVSVPGIDKEVVLNILNIKENVAFKMINILNGNSLARISIISMGLFPYIISVLLFEIVAVSNEKIKRLKYNESVYFYLLKIISFFVAIIESIYTTEYIYNETGLFFSHYELFKISLSLIVGTFIVIWISEQITKLGFGSGIGIIISFGIINYFPNVINNSYDLFLNKVITIENLIFILLILIFVLIIMIKIEKTKIRIPIYNAKTKKHLEIDFNNAGYLPPMLSLIVLNGLLQIFSNFNINNDYIIKYYSYIYFVLIFISSYIYSIVLINNKKLITKVDKKEYILEIEKKDVLDYFKYISFFNALYLSLLMVVPWVILKKINFPYDNGGIYLLIILQTFIIFMIALKENRRKINNRKKGLFE